MRNLRPICCHSIQTSDSTQSNSVFVSTPSPITPTAGCSCQISSYITFEFHNKILSACLTMLNLSIVIHRDTVQPNPALWNGDVPIDSSNPSSCPTALTSSLNNSRNGSTVQNLNFATHQRYGAF